jgi:hypothetical protein
MLLGGLIATRPPSLKRMGWPQAYTDAAVAENLLRVEAKQVRPGQDRNNSAGEMLVYSAADYEDFRVERPDMPPSMEADLETVIRRLATNRWPWRLPRATGTSPTRPSIRAAMSKRVASTSPCTGSGWPRTSKGWRPQR